MQLAWSQIVPSLVLGAVLGFGVPALFGRGPAKRTTLSAQGDKPAKAGDKAGDRARTLDTDESTGIDYARIAQACLRASSGNAGETNARREPTAEETADRERLELVMNNAEKRGVWTRRDSFVFGSIVRKLSPDMVDEVNTRLRSLAESGAVNAEDGTIIPVQ